MQVHGLPLLLLACLALFSIVPSSTRFYIGRSLWINKHHESAYAHKVERGKMVSPILVIMQEPRGVVDKLERERRSMMFTEVSFLFLMFIVTMYD